MHFTITDPDVAQVVVDKAVEVEAITDYNPARIVFEANDVLELLFDAWNNDNIRPDNEDSDVAAMGVVVKEIFDMAGFDPAMENG